MNNKAVEFIRQNVINPNSSSDSKIGKIIFYIICIIGIGIMLFFVIYASIIPKNDENNSTGGKSASARIELGLEVYKNYFNMNQLPISNNGIYFNEYYNQKKYYGLRDFSTHPLINHTYHVDIQMTL